MARPITLADLLEDLARFAAKSFAAFDRGEGIEATTDEFMDGIDHDLGLSIRKQTSV